MSEGAFIKRLSEEVVNRIAAGEVIQRPANAVKEMLENSLDAKSSIISITLKEGGLKFLQIQDNGIGIEREDLQIVCERFTTSKLTRFEDLNSISTFGFRGEALASISHVAHLSIMSKTKDSLCAYKASYKNGKIESFPKPCAANNGTQITVENLFYNVILRRQALRSSSDEHRRVVDLVAKYAVHNHHVEFSVKKQGENCQDLKTPSFSHKREIISLIFGNNIARELIEIEEDKKVLGYKLSSFVTNGNYSSKKKNFILFVNDRLVENNELRKGIETSFASFLPKASHPFIYISLKIPSKNLDVNVHPTKNEVHFLNESEVVEDIIYTIESHILNNNKSRILYTQTLLPINFTDKESEENNLNNNNKNKNNDNNTNNTNNKCLNVSSIVRTDPKIQKIDSFFSQNASFSLINYQDKQDFHNNNNFKINYDNINNHDNNNNDDKNKDDNFNTSNNYSFVVNHHNENINELNLEENDNLNNKLSSVSNLIDDLSQNNYPKEININNNKNNVFYTSLKMNEEEKLKEKSKVKKRRKIKLTSILNLRQNITNSSDSGLRDLFENSSLVGVVDLKWSLVQHSTHLFLVNNIHVLNEFIYQTIIYEFGNFGVIRLSEPVSLFELAKLSLEMPESQWKEENGSKEDLSIFVSNLLTSKAPMLWDYFSIEIDQEGNLLSLPLIFESYTPPLHLLPLFILRLSTEVDWAHELNCFRTLSRELSSFYVFKDPPPSYFQKDFLTDFKFSFENLIYPMIKNCFQPPRSFSSSSSTLLQVANLPDLYKVFERC